jgi:metal-responsive CopG/Arc/MetJ family transcriptional regulator
MTAKRINITIEEEVLADFDATASAYGMNRSECIAFLFDLLGELNAWNVLENVATDGSEEMYRQPTKRDLMKAARKCTVTRD